MPQSTRSLQFDGVNDYASANGALVPLPTGGDGHEMSISGWWRWSASSANPCLIAEMPTNSRWLLFVQGSSLIWRGFSGGDLTAPRPSDDQWHHIAAVMKNFITAVQFSLVQIWVDGVKVADGGPTGLGSGSNLQRFAHGTGQIHLGLLQDIGLYPLGGNSDDVALFDRLLTSTEIAGIYAGTTDVASLSPVALWRTEEGAGSTSDDAVGSADLTLNGATWSTDVPTPLASGGSITASLTATEPSEAATISSAVVVTASVAATDAVDAATISTSVAVAGALAATDAAEAATITSSVLVAWAITATDSSDVAIVTSSIFVLGSAADSDIDETAVIAGEVSSPPPPGSSIGSIVAVDDADSATILGSVSIFSVIVSTDANDTATIAGMVSVVGSVVATDAVGTAVILATVMVSVVGSVVATDAVGTAVILATVGETGPVVTRGRIVLPIQERAALILPIQERAALVLSISNPEIVVS